MDAYDAIITGTGAGGGALARHLAPSGKRVLLLEAFGSAHHRRPDMTMPSVWSTRASFPRLAS